MCALVEQAKSFRFNSGSDIWRPAKGGIETPPLRIIQEPGLPALSSSRTLEPASAGCVDCFGALRPRSDGIAGRGHPLRESSSFPLFSRQHMTTAQKKRRAKARGVGEGCAGAEGA